MENGIKLTTAMQITFDKVTGDYVARGEGFRKITPNDVGDISVELDLGPDLAENSIHVTSNSGTGLAWKLLVQPNGYPYLNITWTAIPSSISILVGYFAKTSGVSGTVPLPPP